jgi:peptidoglycan/LPS O-acetylase OafA/YrhL
MERSRNRISELDALRGIAALSVVLFHYTTRFQQLHPVSAEPALLFGLGHYGVQLFFVISGWVILLSARRADNAIQFASARAARIYPSYVIGMLITAAVIALVGLPGVQITGTIAAGNLLMVHQFLGIPHVDGAYWSLVVEIFFYAAIAGLRTANDLRRVDRIVGVWLIATIAATLVHRKLAVLVSILGYGEFFAAGMLLADIRSSGATWRSRGLLAALVAFHAWSNTLESLVVFGAIAGVCYLVAVGRVRRVPGWLAWVGAISYPLYLLHQNLGYVALRALVAVGINLNVAILVTIGVAIVAASQLSRLIEVPVSQAMRPVIARFGARSDEAAASAPVVADAVRPAA